MWHHRYADAIKLVRELIYMRAEENLEIEAEESEWKTAQEIIDEQRKIGKPEWSVSIKSVERIFMICPHLNKYSAHTVDWCKFNPHNNVINWETMH